MRRLAAILLIAASLPSWSETAAPKERRTPQDASLGKKGTSATPDKSLAGDITRKKEDKSAVPALQYDQFALQVEFQVASKRHEQIDALKKIIALGADKKEAPALLFRLGELYWEESKYYFFEANRKDDDLINAMNRKDEAGMARAKAEKQELLGKSKQYGQQAVEQYSEIVQRYKDFDRTDEVLYFLGTNLLESGEEKKGLIAFKRLIDKYPKSKYIPDAHLAFGESYFNNSKGKRDMLEKALDHYKRAASFPENQAYGFALYKQGWCYFNMTDYVHAKDMFKAVVLYGEFAGGSAIEKDGGKSGKGTLVKEARTDFVRAYSRDGSPTDAKAEFSKVASKPDDRFLMMKQLANLYYEEGKDKEAALVFNMLIKERPLSPEAPGFQGKIVDCVLRAGNKEMTVAQVRRLVKIHDEVVNSGAIKDPKDKKALEEARDLSERTLSNLAVTWHNEAKKTRDDKTFFFANEVYSDYLTLFSDNPKSYDLRFFWAELLNDNLQKFDKAAEAYTQVMMVDAKKIDNKQKPGKWLVNAAYNAILAWDEVVKAAEQSGQLKTEGSNDLNKPVEIPGPKKSLLEACERYMKYVPQGDKRVEVAFKAANIYYRYNHFDEAVKRFSQIAMEHPDYKFENGDRAAEIAANLILDSYNLLGDWAKVNEWARKFYANPKLATGKFREELSRVLEQSAFKLVNQLEAKKEYDKAAEAYLTFVAEFPKSEIADKALYNASIDYFQAKMVEKAVEVRARIMSQYPKSEFVPSCIFANGESLEMVADFDGAAKAYEAYVNGYEKSLGGKPQGRGGKSKAVARMSKKRKAVAADKEEKKEEGPKQVWEESKAQVALYNAAVFRDGLGQYKQALKNRDRYMELWPKSKDVEAVFLSIADLHERYGAFGKAIHQLEEYEKEYKDPSKVLAAEGKIERIYALKQKRPRDSFRLNKRILEYYEKLPSRQKKALDNAASEAVARAHLQDNEEQLQFFSRMKLSWGNPVSPNNLKRSIQEKAKSLEQVQKIYTQTVGFKAADPAICALYKIGLAYANMAQTVENAPIPRIIPEDMRDALHDEFVQQAVPVKDKAAEAFAAAVGKSHELDLSNECSKKSLELLRTTYRPEQFPQVQEAVLEIAAPKSFAVGGDLLAAVQPVASLTPAQQKELEKKAAQAKEELKDLKPKEKESPKEPADPPKTKGNPKNSDEPEDAL